LAFGITFFIAWAGAGIVENWALSYGQYLNGWELQATVTQTHCVKDGSCEHTYSCPETYFDSNGKLKTDDHSCPYATEEDSYTVRTTLGDISAGSHRFPSNPRRWGDPIPQNVINEAGVGAPQAWLDARARTESDKPGPVTIRGTYDNLILASQTTTLHKYSSSIGRYKGMGLLPKLSTSVYDFYHADKVYFVGYKPASSQAWRDSAMRFDSALGTELKGDLHLVIVQDLRISDPYDYANALAAYWSSDEFGNDALSKNGIVVVVGTEDGKTVTWAHATTGMPGGNERMLADIGGDLPGTALDPDRLLGTPETHFSTYYQKVFTVHGVGKLESIVWGQDNEADKFKRVCMKCAGPGDQGIGYNYLAGDVEPSGGQILVVMLAMVLVSVVACGIYYLREDWSE
jgi:hypothetical protein